MARAALALVASRAGGARHRRVRRPPYGARVSSLPEPQQAAAPPADERPSSRPELVLVVLEDDVLYWPVCGHPLDDGAVLYDREVCVRCDDDQG